MLGFSDHDSTRFYEICALIRKVGGTIKSEHLPDRSSDQHYCAVYADDGRQISARLAGMQTIADWHAVMGAAAWAEKRITETIECTAWDTIGKYSQLVYGGTHLIRFPKVKITWESDPVRGYQSVKLRRIVVQPDGSLPVMVRYVKPETKVVLVPIKK